MSNPVALWMVASTLTSSACGPKQLPIDTQTTKIQEPAPVSPAEAELKPFAARYESADSDAEKKEAALSAKDTALLHDDGFSAVLWLVRARALEQDAQARKQLEADILSLIDQRVSFIDVRRLLEEVSDEPFLKEALVYRLGRIQYHIRDLPNAKASLEEVLEKWPTGPYAAGAKALLDVIVARSTTKPNVIGVLVPMSGKLGAYGGNVASAVKLAMGELEPKGKGAPAPFEIVVRDTKGDAVEAGKAVHDLVIHDHAIAIVGALFRVEAEGAATKAEELGVPFVTLTSDADVAAVGPYIFRAGVTNEAQADAIVRYAMDVVGMKTFAILYPRHPYGEDLMHLFWDRVEAKKGVIRGVQSYASNETTFTDTVKSIVGRDVLELRADYHAALRECKKQPDSYRKARCARNAKNDLRPIIDFDALFIPDYPSTLALLTPALAFEDIIVEKDPRYLRRIEKTLGREVRPVTLLGASGWNSSKLPEKAGRYVENALFVDAFFAGQHDPEVQTFVAKFREHFARTPSLPEALFFDAISIMKSVVATRQPTTRDAMRQALHELRDFHGVTGKLSFDATGGVVRQLQVLTIKDGEIKEAAIGTTVAPPPTAKSPQDNL